MANEKDDIDFEALVAEKRHNKTLEALKMLATVSEKNNAEISNAIVNQGKLFSSMVSAIKNIPSDNVNVEVNQDKVVAALERVEKKLELLLLGQTKTNQLLEIMNLQKEIYFTFKRGNGVIESAVGTVHIVSSKYQA